MGPVAADNVYVILNNTGEYPCVGVVHYVLTFDLVAGGTGVAAPV